MVEEEEEVEVFDEGVRDGVEEGIGNLGEIAEPEDERRAEERVDEMPGIRVTSPVDGAKRPGVIFVLEKACLEVGKVGKNFQILNSDHANYLRKQNRNPADYRPDIIHQACMPWKMVLSSSRRSPTWMASMHVTKKHIAYVTVPRCHLASDSEQSVLF